MARSTAKPTAFGRLPSAPSLLMEQWLPAPGYEGRYEVSDLGRIRSLPRIETTSKGHQRPVQGRILATPPRRHDGYPHVCLRIGGKARLVTVHRLVALAFHGDKRSILHNEVAHLDGDRANASAVNLKWVSKVENRSHRKLHGTECNGERHGAARLTNAQAAEIRAMRGNATRFELAARYGVSPYTIDDVMRGRTYRTTIDYRGTLRPTFTCRTVKPPHPRGHRQWLKLEGR